MSAPRDRHDDLITLCDGGEGNYVALIGAVLKRARMDAEAGDPRAYAWLRHSGVRWAAELGIRHPECIAEGIR